MIISLKDVLFLACLLIFVILLRKTTLNKDFFKPVKQYFSSYNRKLNVHNYIREVSKQPEDSQKMIVKEVMIFVIFSLLMLIIASKSIFFTAVVSGSMVPTFEKNDLVLMQNFDHSYKVGDIIMFVEPFTNKPVTHRIARIDDNGVIKTAGDFTKIMDAWDITIKDIRGKALMVNEKPIVIKRYGRFFIVDAKEQELALFGQDYRSYFLFFQVIKIYGYVIVVICVIFYIALTFRQKTWKNR